MTSQVFFFSATGNSLTVARNVARQIQADLLPIPRAGVRGEVQPESNVVGLVFPVYHATFNESGMPHVVEAFIQGLDNIADKYIFCVCTHSGIPGLTVEHLGRLLVARGGTLSASLTIKLGNPYSTPQKLLHALFNAPLSTDREKELRQRKKLLEAAKPQVDRLCQAVLNREPWGVTTRSKVARHLIHGVFSMQRSLAVGRYRQLSGLESADFQELVRNADRSFTVSNQCRGCATCVKVCPSANIRMEGNRPKWLNNCENCYSCFQWCPQNAISGKIAEFEKRYHQPEIGLADVMRA